MLSLARLVQLGFRSVCGLQTRAVRPDRKCRLRIEDLENRQLPSTIVDLGTLNGSYSFAYGLNNRGQVVGISDGFSVTGYFPHAVKWDARHGLQDLGTLNGRYDGYAYGINDRGQIVGSAQGEVILWDRRHGMQVLGMFDGALSQANAINDRGQVVGSGRDAFLWDRRHGFEDLGNLGGGTSSATAINNQGQVVGRSNIDRSGNSDAFLWDAENGMQDLGTLPGSIASYATGINGAGQVIGGTERRLTYHNVFYHGFLWDAKNGMQDLGNFEPLGINDAADVVGDFNRTTAVLYRDGTLTNLNSLLPPNSGWELEQARAINDAGQIVGFGFFNSRDHAFLLTLDGGDRPGAADPGLVQIAQALPVAPRIAAGSFHIAPAEAISVILAHLGPQPMPDAGTRRSPAPREASLSIFVNGQAESSTLESSNNGSLDPSLGDSVLLTSPV